MFKLEIKTDNAAFAEPDGEQTADALAAEVARILRDCANVLEGGATAPTLRDINGNRVGQAWFDEGK